MTQLKKAMKEPSCFIGIYLDPTIYLRWVQTIGDYFKAKGCMDRESLMRAT